MEPPAYYVLIAKETETLCYRLSYCLELFIIIYFKLVYKVWGKYNEDFQNFDLFSSTALVLLKN